MSAPAAARLRIRLVSTSSIIGWISGTSMVPNGRGVGHRPSGMLGLAMGAKPGIYGKGQRTAILDSAYRRCASARR